MESPSLRCTYHLQGQADTNGRRNTLLFYASQRSYPKFEIRINPLDAARRSPEYQIKGTASCRFICCWSRDLGTRSSRQAFQAAKATLARDCGLIYRFQPHHGTSFHPGRNENGLVIESFYLHYHHHESLSGFRKPLQSDAIAIPYLDVRRA
jgi:hypothetical protein